MEKNTKSVKQNRHVEIIGIVSLYNPHINDFNNILSYVAKLDKCVVVDDSEHSNEQAFYSRVGGLCEKVTYIWNGRNIGLSKSLNVGIEKAVQDNADWILLMDSDSTFLSNVVDVYRKYIMFHDTRRIALLAPLHNYGRHRRHPKIGEKEIKLSMLSGCVINVDVLNKIGKFDERYYIDGLDYEWESRAQTKGYKLIRCNNAVLNHRPAHEKRLVSHNVTVFRYGWDTSTRYYYQYKALLMLYSKYRKPYFILLLLYKLIKPQLLFGNRKEYIASWNAAGKDLARGYYGKYRKENENRLNG